MTSVAGVRCPLCGEHLDTSGRTLWEVVDAPDGMTIRHDARCGQCGRAFSVVIETRPVGVRVLSGDAVVSAQSLPLRHGRGRGTSTGANTNP